MDENGPVSAAMTLHLMYIYICVYILTMQIQSRFLIEVWQLQTCEKFKVHHCFHLGSTLTTSTLVCQKFDVQLFPTQYIDFPFLKS